MEENITYKTIKYYEVINIVKDGFYKYPKETFIERFVRKRDAERFRQEKDSELLIKFKENPDYLTGIKYIVKEQRLMLRK